MSKTPAPRLKPGDTLHDFTVLAVTPLPDLFMVTYELEHPATGAQMLHMHSEDAENLFSINFPTEPPDDTGVPHILEHAVLSGSKLFPVRDPFFEMYKMSMATFINAMTGKDCTYYPVCSNVRADLFNLATVYFDAVFHPLLTEATFKREGHHLAPADSQNPTGELIFNGIVFNEMKAVYAKPESLIWREMCRQILPDTGYGFDSGGDPEAIPDLTYEDFLAFHKRYYHPSNAKFVCYGDIEPEAILAFLQPRLAEFSRQPALPLPEKQPDWSEPRRFTSYYDGDDDNAKSFLRVSWKVPGATDVEAQIWLNTLSLVLLGDDAAPLKRAIVDSGMGADLDSSGILFDEMDGIFSVGIKGAEADNPLAFRQLILDTLEKLCEEGVEPDLVESAFKQYQYSISEISAMRPLTMAFNVLGSWLHGGDPLRYLGVKKDMELCYRKWRENPGILCDFIRVWLLDNPHRLDQSLLPDNKLRERLEKKERERLADIRQTIDDDDMAALAEESRRLQLEAGTPNSPEDLATLPQLGRSDLPPEPLFVPVRNQTLTTGAEFLRNEVFANGVNYLSLHMDLEGLPENLWEYLPFYIETLTKMGAAGRDYAQMAKRHSAAMGGYAARSRFVMRADGGGCGKGVVVSLKALDSQFEEAMGVLADRLLDPDPRDKARLRDVVKQLLSRLQTNLVNAGDQTALAQLRRGLSEAGYLIELTGGRSLYRNAGKVSQNFDDKAETIIDAVLRIHTHLRQTRKITAGFTGGDKQAARAIALVEELTAGAPETTRVTPIAFRPFASEYRVGLAAPMQVGHCAQALSAPHVAHPDAPMLMLGMSLLRVDYMVSELRFKGNAYGAACAFAGDILTLSTYADPHIKRTLDVFAALPEYIRTVKWTDTEITRGILSTARNFVRPIRPEESTTKTLAQYVSGYDDDLARSHYEAIRAANPAAVREALLRTLVPAIETAPVVIVSNREKLEEANRELGERSLQIEPLL